MEDFWHCALSCEFFWQHFADFLFLLFQLVIVGASACGSQPPAGILNVDSREEPALHPPTGAARRRSAARLHSITFHQPSASRKRAMSLLKKFAIVPNHEKCGLCVPWDLGQYGLFYLFTSNLIRLHI